MSDIVVRLRDPVIRWMSTHQAEREEAAAEIERLRSALTGILNEWEERDEGPTLPFVLGLTMAGIARAALEGKDDAPSHPHA